MGMAQIIQIGCDYTPTCTAKIIGKPGENFANTAENWKKNDGIRIPWTLSPNGDQFFCKEHKDSAKAKDLLARSPFK